MLGRCLQPGVDHAASESASFHPRPRAQRDGRRPHHRRILCHALGSVCPAWHGCHLAAAGHSDRPGYPQARRQCHRCGDCRECRTRAHGADRQRHGRRPVRHRVGCEKRQTLWLQRLGSRAAKPEPAMVQGQRLHEGSAVRSLAGDHAGHGRRLVCPAWAFRQAADERRAGSGHRLCARGLSRQRADRLVLEPVGAAPVEIPGLQRAIHDRWPRSGQGRNLEEPAPGQHA